MLVLSRKINQSIMIGDAVEIRIVDIKGDQVKVGIAAPRTVPVYRKEVYDEIRSTNVAAAASSQTLSGLGQLFGKQPAAPDGGAKDKDTSPDEE